MSSLRRSRRPDNSPSGPRESIPGWVSLWLDDFGVLAAPRAAGVERVGVLRVRPFLDQFRRRDCLKRDDQPIPAADDALVPGLGRDQDPALLQRGAAVADKEMRSPAIAVVDLEVAASAPGHHPLPAVRVAFRAGGHLLAEDEDPARLDLGLERGAVDGEGHRLPGLDLARSAGEGREDALADLREPR